jgi:hypothetical protein
MTAYAKKQDGQISILNRTDKEITVRVTVYEKFWPEVKNDIYAYVLFARLNNLDLDGIIVINDLNPVVLKPSKEQFFFLYSQYTKGGENFRDREVIEQFKAIYQYLSVTDEDGNELLNIDTLKSSNFIQRGTVRWALIIE